MKNLLCVTFFLLCSFVSAKTYYVAPTGSSDINPGTINQPWATWQKAFNTAVAGDTVYFRNGVWYITEGISLINRNGTADNYIHFLNYPGETPILDGSYRTPPYPSGGESWSGGIYVDNSDYIHWRGLTIRNFWQIWDNVKVQGLVVADSKYNVFDNVTVHHISGRGIFYTPPIEVDSTYFINCDVYNCVDSMDTGGVQGGWGDGWNAGNMTTDSYLLFDGCRAWNNSDDGFNLWGAGLVEVKNSWSFCNGRLAGDGNGFKVTDAAVINNDYLGLTRRLTNNLAAFNFGNTGGGFTEANNGYYSIEGQWYNNTAYRNMIGFITGGWLTPPQRNNDYKNNISCESTWYTGLEVDEMTWAGGSFQTSIANTWTSGVLFNATPDDFVLTDSAAVCTQLSAPRKDGGSLPDITAFKLVAGSDLIDAGVYVGLPFTGSAPDIGYIEYSSGSITPSVPIFYSAVIENITPSRLEMTYNLTLANIVPVTSAFTVKINSVTRTISSVTISGTKVILTLASPVFYGDVVTVAYTKPVNNPLQTASGAQAASLSTQNVKNNVAAQIPVYISSVIENATPDRVEIIYSLTLANIIPVTTAFTVKVNSVTRTISSVTISGTKVILTLASPVVNGDVVTLAYTKPATNPLQTAAGGQATSLTAQSVINNCSPVANQPPVVTIISPTKGLTVTEPATITIEATASDPDGSVTKVEFYSSNSKLGEINSSPYNFIWKDVLEGVYTLYAIATDNSGSKTVSETVVVIVEKSALTVNELPVVNITYSIRGSTKKPKKHDNIVLTATAYDPDGSIKNVEFKSGDVTLDIVGTSPYEYILQDIDTGTFIITAIATDNLGASTVSAPIEIYVSDMSENSTIVNLSPNPNNGHFAVDIYSEIPDVERKITVISITGCTIYEDKLEGAEHHKEIDLSTSTSGAYILVISSNNRTIGTKKFIKK